MIPEAQAQSCAEGPRTTQLGLVAPTKINPCGI